MHLKKLAALMLTGLVTTSLTLGSATLAQAQTSPKKDDHAGHDHAKEKKDDHAGHDHAKEKKGAEAGDSHGHGKGEDLGTTTVAGLTLSVGQVGTVKAGNETVFGATLEKGQTKPKAIRAWVGVSTAEGSTKAKGEAEGDHYDFHVEVPKKMPEGSRLWIEVEPATGKKVRTSFDLKR